CCPRDPGAGPAASPAAAPDRPLARRAWTSDRKASLAPPRDLDGDGFRPLVAPAGQARGPAPRAAAGAHDQDVLGALEQVAPRGGVGRLGGAGQPRGALEIGHRAPRVLDEEVLDLAAAPAALAQDV